MCKLHLCLKEKQVNTLTVWKALCLFCFQNQNNLVRCQLDIGLNCLLRGNITLMPLSSAKWLVNVIQLSSWSVVRNKYIEGYTNSKRG